MVEDPGNDLKRFEYRLYEKSKTVLKQGTPMKDQRNQGLNVNPNGLNHFCFVLWVNLHLRLILCLLQIILIQGSLHTQYKYDYIQS